MAARIVSLVRPQPASQRRSAVVAAGRVPLGLTGRAPDRQHAWRGASGRLYAHYVYALIECPPLPPSGYVLVRRDEQGRCTPLRIDVGSSDAPTLNLAEIRQRGAQAGANEVHIRLGGSTDSERRLAACDLRAGLLGSLAATPATKPAADL